MAATERHGGGCCGRYHLYGFRGDETVREIKTLIERREGSLRRTRGLIWEATLTNSQCIRYPNLLKSLKEVGFSLVYRGTNMNSGNCVNVFMYHRKPSSLTEVPFKWDNGDE